MLGLLPEQTKELRRRVGTCTHSRLAYTELQAVEGEEKSNKTLAKTIQIKEEGSVAHINAVKVLLLSKRVGFDPRAV